MIAILLDSIHATAFYTFDKYAESLEQLRIYGQDRAKSISAQLEGQQPTTSYGTIETTLDLSAFGSMGNGKDKAGGGMQTDVIASATTDKSDSNTKSDSNANTNGDAKTNGGGMPNGGMPDRENMQAVMEIVQGATDRDFTEDEIAQLKELGIEENMISQLKNMGNQGMPNMPNKNMGNAPNSNSVNRNNSTLQNWGVLIACILAICVGIIFVMKYKKKKY